MDRQVLPHRTASYKCSVSSIRGTRSRPSKAHLLGRPLPPTVLHVFSQAGPATWNGFLPATHRGLDHRRRLRHSAVRGGFHFRQAG
jgi:hypothetical protein